jgi:hypothetical protein
MACEFRIILVLASHSSFSYRIRIKSCHSLWQTYLTGPKSDRCKLGMSATDYDMTLYVYGKRMMNGLRVPYHFGINQPINRCPKYKLAFAKGHTMNEEIKVIQSRQHGKSKHLPCCLDCITFISSFMVWPFAKASLYFGQRFICTLIAKSAISSSTVGFLAQTRRLNTISKP